MINSLDKLSNVVLEDHLQRLLASLDLVSSATAKAAIEYRIENVANEMRVRTPSLAMH